MPRSERRPKQAPSFEEISAFVARSRALQDARQSSLPRPRPSSRRLLRLLGFSA